MEEEVKDKEKKLTFLCSQTVFWNLLPENPPQKSWQQNKNRQLYWSRLECKQAVSFPLVYNFSTAYFRATKPHFYRTLVRIGFVSIDVSSFTLMVRLSHKRDEELIRADDDKLIGIFFLKSALSLL